VKKRTIIKEIFKGAKKVKNTVMSDSDKNNKDARTKHADTVIRNHVIWSMGAGLIPILIADIFAVSALQLDMIRQMCKVYDIDFKETQGKAIVTSLTSSTLARIGARSLIKLIPGVGSMLGGITVSIFSGASTYALGEVFKLHFETGGTILDFDPDRLKKKYSEMFEKGKKVAANLRNEKDDYVFTNDEADEVEVDVTEDVVAESITDSPVVNEDKDVLTKLKELGDLKEAGVISQEEFDNMKKKLIDEF